MDVNVNGVLFTAQAAGRQMARFGNGGSIVLIASMAGTIALEVSKRQLDPPQDTDTDGCRCVVEPSLDFLPLVERRPAADGAQYGV